MSQRKATWTDAGIAWVLAVFLGVPAVLLDAWIVKWLLGFLPLPHLTFWQVFAGLFAVNYIKGGLRSGVSKGIRDAIKKRQER